MPSLFRTLILRPLRRDKLRSLLTLMAVALGVAVVIAIDLAGAAAVGSFRNSLTTMVGKTDLEIIAGGGVDERLMGTLAALPVRARFSPVIESAIRVEPVGFVNMYGIDFVASFAEGQKKPSRDCGDAAPVLVTQRLAARLPRDFTLNGRAVCVAQTVDARGPDFIVADIADAQQIVGRFGKLDRIDVVVQPGEDFEGVQTRVRALLPPGYELTRPGSRSDENQKMLRAFRSNLQVLSYISLLVGAFLIYNTVSISVVRRRAEIGILRALGASRHAILFLFLAEAAGFGVVGAALGILLGRLFAGGVVSLIAETVNALYTSSAPGPIELTLQSAGTAFASGVFVALASAWAPAREAMFVNPTEAMGRGSRESRARVHLRRDLWIAAGLAVASFAAAQAPAIGGRPVFGYAATLLAIGAAALCAPALVLLGHHVLRGLLRRWFGAAGLVASRSLAAALSRTGIVVAALATSIAMMASVAIMVGSFRETVLSWLDHQLRADLYLRAAGIPSAGNFVPIPNEVPKLVAAIDGVEAVDVFSASEFRFEGLRATLASGSVRVQHRFGRLRFLEGDDSGLYGHDRCLISEPFANKHHLHAGETITVPIGRTNVRLQIAGVYYEYSSEQGYVVVDTTTMQRYAPGTQPEGVAIYFRAGADRARVRRKIEDALAKFPVVVAPNEELRRQAVIIFDRTFAITWALEAVAIFVAMLGAANALLALVLDRRREFGMLRYLGAAQFQVRRIILVEAGLLGLFANVLGASLGLVLSLVLIYVVDKQSFGWTIQFHLPLLLLAGALMLVGAVTILAGLYPARVAARLNPIEVVHEE